MKTLWDLSKLCEKKSKPCGQNGTDHPGVSPPYVTGAIIHCCGISSRKFRSKFAIFLHGKNPGGFSRNDIIAEDVTHLKTKL